MAADIERRKNQMSREEIEDIVSACVRQVFEEERASFFIEPEKHYQHHQMMEACAVGRETWRKNHEFVESVRSGAEIAKKAGVTAAVIAFLSFMIGAFWLAVKHEVMK